MGKTIAWMSVVPLCVACAGRLQPASPATSGERTCRGDVAVHDQHDLAAISGCNVIEGDLRVEHTALASLRGLEQLHRVEGTLRIADNAHLASLDGLGGLASANRVEIANNPALRRIDGLRRFERAGSVAIGAAPRLRSVRGLDHLGYLGKLVIDGTGARDLGGLEQLRAVGDLVLRDNPQLLRLDGLEGLEDACSVDIEHNRVLLDVGALARARVAGPVVVRDNAAVADSQAAWLTANTASPVR